MAKGLCKLHYDRWRKNGATDLPKRPTDQERFWAKVDKAGPGDCWNWKASGNAYGTFRYDGQSGPAHRFAYDRFVGPIPEGLHIDHLCKNKRCVNPAHLEPVTRSENELRKHGGVCKYGHELTPENSYVRPDRSTRTCKTCLQRRSREWRERNRSD